MKSFPWQLLLDWYREHGRHDYPWRQYGNARFKMQDSKGMNTHTTSEFGINNLASGIYHVWLAEILLQQTQADRVVPFYERILGKYPTIEHLARADYDEFFPYYQGLGYYSRARNLLKTANIVSSEHAGVFPRDKQQLKKLPGVGEYTARAILAFGYGEALLAWDTNLEIIFSRYYRGAKNIKLTDDEKREIERDFQDFISHHCEACSNPEYQKPGSPHSAIALFAMTDTVDKISQKQEIRGNKIFSKGVYGGVNDGEINFIDKEIRSFSEISRDINNALMDWARTMEPKNTSLLDTNRYIFTESEFYITKGVDEIIEKKISVSFPTPDAQVVVILHQDHRVYYGTRHPVAPQHGIYILGEDPEFQKPQSLSRAERGNDKNGYSPFILPPSLDRDTRRYVQEYFRQNYQLELSVRPVHKKWITTDGRPYIAVNAQVQAGDASIFEQYNKIEMKTTIEQLYSL